MQGPDALFLGGLLGWAVLAASLLSVLRLILVIAAVRSHADQGRPEWGPPAYEPVSVIVPVRNNVATVEATLQSLLRTSYPMEIIVVDDGSTDGTVALVERYTLLGVRLVRQPGAGTAAALNTGIALARGNLIVTTDGATVFGPDTISLLARPFAQTGVGAVCGTLKAGDGDEVLSRWPHSEDTTWSSLDRRLFDLSGYIPTVPVALGAFRREALADVGGVSADTAAEDTDLTMALLRAGWRIVHERDAVAWSEPPSSLGQTLRQRSRLSQGLVQAIWKHRRTVWMSGSAGQLGRRGLPYLVLFQVLLPLLAPLVDFYALYGLLFGGVAKAALAWLGFLGVQLAAFRYAGDLEGEPRRIPWSLPLQQVVSRQMTYLVLIRSAATAVYSTWLGWQWMGRHGVAHALGGERAGG
jgi:cellulose synthase/poly-beta-1,6-N-acetylglucosamine synthase-like glycosyltransferase